MEPWYEFGLEATRWLQATYPQLGEFMAYVSMLGRFEFYLALLPLIYWCVDKRLGVTLTYLLVLGDLLTDIGKQTLREPRPYWLDPELELGSEESYGIPSGHVASATITATFLAGYFRKRWLWFLATLFVLLMFLSRIYLGVHFVHDGIAGLAVGALALGGYIVWQRYLRERFRNRILGQRLLVAFILPLVLGALYLAIRLIIGGPDLEVPWAAMIPALELQSTAEVISGLAILLGLGIGFVLEVSRVRFLVDGTVWQRVLRYLLGIAGTLLIWRGLGALFEPVEPLWLALPLRFFRYLLLGLWAAYYAPMLFVALRLAPARPEPEISLNISR